MCPTGAQEQSFPRPAARAGSANPAEGAEVFLRAVKEEEEEEILQELTLVVGGVLISV